MKRRTIFITGTDTGVGKTVLTSLLARFLRDQKIPVAAFKPVCSGGRDDARALHAALGGTLTLDEINPWYFRAPVSPLLAARNERRKVMLCEVVEKVRQLQKRFPALIVEGAGGLLSPLGENFDSRDLIKALRAIPVIVALNRLGMINQIYLTLEALPRGVAQRAQVVLMELEKPDVASDGNVKFLKEKLGRRRIHVLPWMGDKSPESYYFFRETLGMLTRSAGI